MSLQSFLAAFLSLALLNASDLSAPLVNLNGPTKHSYQGKRLKCTPQKLFRGDTLTLVMSKPHGGMLGVRAPDGTDFFVVYEPNNEEPGASPLMSTEEFTKLGELKLVTDKTKAKPWVYGRDKNELIFTRTGWYVVSLSENLETDDGTPVYQCKVHYTHRART